MNDLQTTTGNQPLTLTQQLSEVTEQLQPASPDAVASAVLKLHRAGLAYPPGLDAHRAGDIYGFACKGIAIEALKRAVVKIIQAEIPKISRDFMPTPPGLAAIARAEALPLWRDRERLIETQQSLSLGKPAPAVNEEARARVRALVEQCKASAEAFRNKDRPPEKSADELNHLYRNRDYPPPDAPPSTRWSDEEWHKQQGNRDYGDEENGSFEGEDRGDLSDRPEG